MNPDKQIILSDIKTKGNKNLEGLNMTVNDC